MGHDWDALGGEKGRPVVTGRLGRALRLGRLATRVGGSTIANAIKKRFGDKGDGESSMAGAALRHADHIVQVMGQMKGAAMKIGQMISADPDLVAPEFADRLARLQRNAPPMDFHTVRTQIEAALDRPLPDLFRYFDPEPVGSASIGQVHRARLFDGRDVAVKVQYPGIVESLDADLKNLGNLLAVGRVFVSKERLDGFLAEAREVILNEADYALEGRNLERYGKVLAEYEGIRVPAPVHEMTARTVLTMEYVPGEKLDEALGGIDDPAERDRLITRFVETFVGMFHDRFMLHADPHPGNFLLDPDHRIVFLDFGCIREFPPALTDGILHLLVAFWRRDPHRMIEVFRELGFGTDPDDYPRPEVLQAYHDIVLEPIRDHAPFDFGNWSVHGRLRRFMREHLEMIKLVPPPEMLLYLRVLAGLKGLLTRMGARIELRSIAEAACRRRGVLEGGA